MWSIAPLLCTTRSEPYWLESMRFRSASLVCSLTEEDALVFFNMASLETRRGIAMLGLIHRDGSWKRPETLREHVPTHTTIDLSETLLAPPVTPWFPKSSETGPFHTGSHRCLVVEQKSAAAMQHELQCLLKFRAVNREDGWRHTFPLYVSLSEHPLHHFS